jgi:hypothetical protein
MLAMMIGMLILMVVAFCICAGITVMAYRKRHPSGDERRAG